MPKRSSKPGDPNLLTGAIVRESTGKAPVDQPEREKDPNAVALGRKGGLKGGKARAEKLTAEERSAIAKRAAAARWAKR